MFGISGVYLKQLQAIFEGYNVAIFGSRARGNYAINSDIDICIFDQIDTQTYLNLLILIDEIEMPYKLDLVIWHQIDNQLLKKNILKEKVKL
jgi:predicted nucleotidyltransferase